MRHSPLFALLACLLGLGCTSLVAAADGEHHTNERAAKERAAAQAEPAAKGDKAEKIAEKGELSGVVAEVDPKGVVVVQGKEQRMSFVPRWVGGLPKDGGGLDKDMLAKIRALRPGSEVTVGWLNDERPRAITLTVTKEGPAAGVFSGLITAINKEKGIITVTNEQEARTFTPHWKGGMPNNGGGLDKAIIAAVAAFKEGDMVSITWAWEERYRVEGIVKAK